MAVLKELKAKKADPSAGEAKKIKKRIAAIKRRRTTAGKGGKEAGSASDAALGRLLQVVPGRHSESELADYGPERDYGYSPVRVCHVGDDADDFERTIWNARGGELLFSAVDSVFVHYEGGVARGRIRSRIGRSHARRWENVGGTVSGETDVGDIVNHMLSQWIQSYRDLPIKLNQWCNVHRWEMRTRPFIRTLEFLWQEGHTAHATAEEANAMAMEMIKVYSEFAEKTLAMPVIVGKKSSIESFAGAKATFTMEAMMGDKKALQAGTSHDLGDNFAKAFETTFLDTDGKQRRIAWGVSTRMMGGVIMTHGDDKGLTLPPKLAPVQVIVTPIWQKNKDKESVMASCDAITKILKEAGIRVKIDADDTKSPGWKFNFWEMKGVPIRIEIGPRDVEKNACVVARRDVPGKEGKEFGVSAEKASLVEKINVILDEIQDAMLKKARKFRDENIVDCATMADLEKTIEDGKWARCAWEGSDEEEKEIKEKTGATIRCFPFEQPSSVGNCIQTGKPAKEVCIFAKSY